MQDGTPLRAEILSGVYTNCIYDLTIKTHVNPHALIAPGTDTTAYFDICPIFVGSNDADGNWILVHLPYLSLENLNLDPPRPDLTDVSSIDDVFSRLKTAGTVISSARGQLGADQNRLEHCKNELGVSREQNTESYSVIRDTDVAEAMMEHTKLSILNNLRQANLAHIMEGKSSVLKLMQ